LPTARSPAYTYDNNGNLLNKTDARGATGSYTYDTLNRMTVQSRWAASDGTTTINFFYDSAPNGKGRLWYTYDANQEGTANWSYNQPVIAAYSIIFTVRPREPPGTRWLMAQITMAIWFPRRCMSRRQMT
jgi:YD repeat-containing protein